eukprot:1577650-Prymnesium_polylepis.1
MGGDELRADSVAGAGRRNNVGIGRLQLSVADRGATTATTVKFGEKRLGPGLASEWAGQGAQKGPEGMRLPKRSQPQLAHRHGRQLNGASVSASSGVNASGGWCGGDYFGYSGTVACLRSCSSGATDPRARSHVVARLTLIWTSLRYGSGRRPRSARDRFIRTVTISVGRKA